MEGLTLPLISSGLKTEVMGREVRLFDELDSTNTTARDLALSGAPEGTAVIAERQRGGKGRRGRGWYSPGGKNIYTSLILRPPILPAEAPRITLLSAVALAETLIEAGGGGGVRIKWPNDILMEERKCAGILTEMKCSHGRIDFVVVGIGINVNMAPGDFSPEIAPLATSLAAEAGHPFSRPRLLQVLYSKMENWYKRYLGEGFSPVRERWNQLSGVNGRFVRAASSGPGGEGYEEGMALGLDDAGALILEKGDGRRVAVASGEIALLY